MAACESGAPAAVATAVTASWIERDDVGRAQLGGDEDSLERQRRRLVHHLADADPRRRRDPLELTTLVPSVPAVHLRSIPVSAGPFRSRRSSGCGGRG